MRQYYEASYVKLKLISAIASLATDSTQPVSIRHRDATAIVSRLRSFPLVISPRVRIEGKRDILAAIQETSRQPVSHGAGKICSMFGADGRTTPSRVDKIISTSTRRFNVSVYAAANRCGCIVRFGRSTSAGGLVTGLKPTLNDRPGAAKRSQLRSLSELANREWRVHDADSVKASKRGRKASFLFR